MTAPHKIPRRNVHGILLLDKPPGVTSNGALQRVKRLYQAHKAGHTGSLDPLASGVLPICLGEATKVSGFLLDADKYYRVGIVLGVTTTTADADGEIIDTKPVAAGRARIVCTAGPVCRAYSTSAADVFSAQAQWSAVISPGETGHRGREGAPRSRDFSTGTEQL